MRFCNLLYLTLFKLCGIFDVNVKDYYVKVNDVRYDITDKIKYTVERYVVLYRGTAPLFFNLRHYFT